MVFAAHSTLAAPSAAQAVREAAFALKLYPFVGVLAVGISFGSAFLGYPIATLQGPSVTESPAITTPPAISPPAPPATPTPPATVVDPDPAPAVAGLAAPGDRIPEGLPLAPYVYNVNSEKVGKIVDVLRGNDGKVELYIVGVGDWFLNGSEKSIAVPFQKMTWVKGQNYWTKQDEWTPVVSMTKADVQNAPKQVFDPTAKKKWSPAQ